MMPVTCRCNGLRLTAFEVTSRWRRYRERTNDTVPNFPCAFMSDLKNYGDHGRLRWFKWFKYLASLSSRSTGEQVRSRRSHGSLYTTNFQPPFIGEKTSGFFVRSYGSKSLLLNVNFAITYVQIPVVQRPQVISDLAKSLRSPPQDRWHDMVSWIRNPPKDFSNNIPFIDCIISMNYSVPYDFYEL